MKKSALILDFYALTMANVYHRFLPKAEATFDLFIRTLPKNRSFLVACGIDDALSYLKKFSFDKEDIEYLKNFKLEKDFLKYLSKLKFSGDVWAVKEGTLVFPEEPIMRITAPLAQAQLVEAYLLNAINLHSAIATKAARVVISSKKRPVFDFSLRRTQGFQTSLNVARSSYIAGCAGTSNVLAGKMLDIKVVGTMAHSFVMAFDSELESFRAYARAFPNQTILLLDTYNYDEGIKNALIVASELKERGFKLAGVRLDSGNLTKESKKIRKILNKNGFSYVKIIASGNLDEYKIEKLIKSNAPIDGFGVGTNMGVASDAPYCDVVYKLSEINKDKLNFSPKMKLSWHKITYPGRKQVYRLKDKKGNFQKDILALEKEKSKGQRLLIKMIGKGKLIRKPLDIGKIRDFVKKQIEKLPVCYKSININKRYPVIKSSQLRKMTLEIMDKFKEIA